MENCPEPLLSRTRSVASEGMVTTSPPGSSSCSTSGGASRALSRCFCTTALRVRSFSSTCLFFSRSTFQSERLAEARRAAPRIASPSESDATSRTPMRRPADNAMTAPGGLRAATNAPARRSPTKPPAPRLPPRSWGRPRARWKRGAAVRRTTKSPSAFVPQAPRARERSRARPSPRTTIGRAKAAKPKNWSVASAKEAPTRPAQFPGRASGSATDEKSDGSAGS